MTTKSPPMSAEALLELPQGHLRHELIVGELRGIAPAGHEHGRLEGEDVAPGWALPLTEFFNTLGEKR